MASNYLLSLLQIADPALPIGGYSHSAGLETYVQQGVVNDVASATAFVTGMLEQNLRYTDAAFVSLAYDATVNNDINSLLQLDNECTAVKLPREMRQASQKLGTRLIKIFDAFVNNETAKTYRTAINEQRIAGHYCIAFGIYTAALAIPKEEALTGFYYNAAAGMVTNCVKLIPLGQQDGQQLLFRLQSVIESLVNNSITPDKNKIGMCCTGFDIRSMQHEQLYSRLYMS
jgi:urease accessory protein